MSVLFLRVVNLAIAAGWLVLAVLVLRLLLKKAPKWTRLLLWAVVALRLLCPVSVETVWSLLPSAETVPLDIERAAAPAIASGVEAVDRVINPALQQSFAPDPAASANPLQIWIPVLSLLWLAGAAALLLYAALSYLRLRRRVATAVRLRDNIYQSEQIPAPFVLGLARPRIYVPFCLSDQDLEHVLAHERAHIARRDHWWKLLGFVLLSVYWFQPLLWLAYVLLGRDLELACDERVIQSLDREHRADYTQALVRCSVSRRTVAACPLTFGEVGVKARVKAVLHYKKPTVWVLMVAVLAAIAAAVCFLTGPKTARTFPLTGTNAADLDPAAIVARTAEIVGLEDGGSLYMGQDQFDQYFDADFNWDADAAIRFFYNQGQQTLGSQLRLYREDGVSFVTEPTAWEAQPVVYLLYDYLKALQCLPQAEIREMAPADRYLVTFQHGGAPEDYDRVLTYTADGPGELDGWYIHLRLEPLHAAEGIYTGTGDEVIHLFYGERYAAVPPEEESVSRWIGSLFGAADPEDASAVAAEFGETKISREVVTYYREIFTKTRGAELTEREVVDEIVGNLILAQEAERLGLGATDEEVAAQLEATRQWYEENETVRMRIDDFCEGAGISVEDYYGLLAVQLPNTIARAKLTEALDESQLDALLRDGLAQVTYYLN